MSFAEFAVSPSKRFDWVVVFGPTFGLGTTDQLVPSKCSIKVSVAACLGGAIGVEKPTAHTSFGARAPSLTFPAAQAKVGEIATTPCRKLLLSAFDHRSGKRPPRRAIKVDRRLAHRPNISFGEDAEGAKSSLLEFAFGVGTTWKVEPVFVCPCAGKP